MYKMRCSKCKKSQLHENGQCFACGLVTSEHNEPSSVFFKKVQNISSSERYRGRPGSSRTYHPTVTYIFDDSNCND